jgi:hypothetical protein
VRFCDGFWHWEINLPDGTNCAMSTIPYATAEDAEQAMEETAALLRAACLKFFDKRAA